MSVPHITYHLYQIPATHVVARLSNCTWTVKLLTHTHSQKNPYPSPYFQLSMRFVTMSRSRSSIPRTIVLLCCCYCCCWLSWVHGFVVPTPTTITHPYHYRYHKLSASQKNLQADFDYQELKLQLRAMKEQNVLSNQLTDSKKGELETYVRKIVNRRESSLQKVQSQLPGSTWQLMLSTQSLMQSLPPGVSIWLRFLDSQRVDYSMEFTKTLGLNKLTAISSYQVDVSFFKTNLTNLIHG